MIVSFLYQLSLTFWCHSSRSFSGTPKVSPWYRSIVGKQSSGNFKCPSRDIDSLTGARSSWDTHDPLEHLPKVHLKLDFCHKCIMWFLGHDLNLWYTKGESSVNNITKCGWLQGSICSQCLCSDKLQTSAELSYLCENYNF